jgi:anti-sigma B factor antagonist
MWLSATFGWFGPASGMRVGKRSTPFSQPPMFRLPYGWLSAISRAAPVVDMTCRLSRKFWAFAPRDTEGQPMELIVETLPNGVTRAALIGRMDIDGAAKIDLRFNALSSVPYGLAADLSEVTFIASMGIRTLMLCARTMAAGGRRLALVNPQPNVEKALRATGVDEVMEIFLTLDSAAEALRA